jgi:hypothetical protein
VSLNLSIARIEVAFRGFGYGISLFFLLSAADFLSPISITLPRFRENLGKTQCKGHRMI